MLIHVVVEETNAVTEPYKVYMEVDISDYLFTTNGARCRFSEYVDAESYAYDLKEKLLAEGYEVKRDDYLA